MLYLKEIKNNSKKLLSFTEETRVQALENLAHALKEKQNLIISENQKDINDARKQGLTSSLIDRLVLDAKRIEAMSASCLEIAKQPAVVGIFSDEILRPNGFFVKKQRIPLGVIAMIFESRPNVVIDAIALAIKSGNALILKGGKEALHSNRVLFDIAFEAVKNIFSEKVFHLLDNRDEVKKLLKQNKYVDLVIARGGSELVRFVKKTATMPVMAHDKGLCHLYVHSDADISYVEDVIKNSKLSRTSVCNALESLVIHEKYPKIKELIDALVKSGIEVRGCSKTQSYNGAVTLANKEDYATEYLDKIISCKVVKNIKEALKHISQNSSQHTEAILAQDQKIIEQFIQALDSSCIAVNTSTRFNDGGELGLGAELGISTSKFHAYGPMGAKEMTTTRFVIVGSGQVRA